MNRNRIAAMAMRTAQYASALERKLHSQMSRLPAIHWGRRPAAVTGPAVILFPCRPNQLCCGLAGIIAVKGSIGRPAVMEMSALNGLVDSADAAGLDTRSQQAEAITSGYLGGQDTLDTLLAEIRSFKQEAPFLALFKDPASQKALVDLSARLSALLKREQSLLSKQVGILDTQAVDVITSRIEALKDMIWCLDMEVTASIGRIRQLMPDGADKGPDSRITVFRQINAVLNSIDRLEVRGRDSAGISLLFVMPAETYETLATELNRQDLVTEFERRMDRDVLGNSSISLNRSATDEGGPIVALTVVYKIAAEIGSLGDNIRFLRGQIQPIGGVNRKIEGFFDLCRQKGLTGRQGVLIP